MAQFNDPFLKDLEELSDSDQEAPPNEEKEKAEDKTGKPQSQLQPTCMNSQRCPLAGISSQS